VYTVPDNGGKTAAISSPGLGFLDEGLLISLYTDIIPDVVGRNG
jgi:hypothetical protein